MPAENPYERMKAQHDAYRAWNEAYQAAMYEAHLKATSVENLQAEYMRGDIDVDELEAKLEVKFST